MKKGRQKNFTAKLIDPRNPTAFHAAALVGNVAFTEGGELARKLIESGCQQEDPAWSRLLNAQLAGAVVTLNVKLLQEVTEFVEMTIAMRKAGPAAPFQAHALNFIHFCRWARKIPDEVVKREIAKSRTVLLAYRRAPFTPSVREIWSYVCDVMDPNEAPDKKTVERFCEAIGHKAAPRARVMRGQFCPPEVSNGAKAG